MVLPLPGPPATMIFDPAGIPFFNNLSNPGIPVSTHLSSSFISIFLVTGFGSLSLTVGRVSSVSSISFKGL